MANSYQKNILRTFQGSKSRFIAIFAIVALGVGFLAGLLSTTPDMEESMEAYLDDGGLYDLRVVSSLGLTDDDVAALEQVEGVAKAQGGLSADLLVEQGGSELVCRIHSLPDDPQAADALNRLTLMEGRWPQSPGECLVEAGIDTLNRSYNVGDTLTLDPDNEDLEDTMEETSFTVVGVVHDTRYFSFEREPASVGSGAVQVVLYAPAAAFANRDTYTEVYVAIEGAAELLSFDDEYAALADTVAERVEAIADARCQARYDEVVGEAQAEIDDGWQEYYDAKAEAEQELADAAQELADGRAELADGEAEYQDGERQYADGLAEIEENEALIADGEQQMEDGRRQLADAQAEYESGAAQLADGERLLNDGQKQWEEAQKQYDDGLRQYEDGLAEFEEGKKQYEEGLALYEAGRQAYDEGLALYQAGEEQYAQLTQLNQAYNGVQAGIAAIVASGQATSESAARELFSDETIAQLEQAKTLAELYDAKQAAYEAWQQALAAAEGGQEQPDPGQEPPDPGQEPPDTGQEQPDSGQEQPDQERPGQEQPPAGQTGGQTGGETGGQTAHGQPAPQTATPESAAPESAAPAAKAAAGEAGGEPEPPGGEPEEPGGEPEPPGGEPEEPGGEPEEPGGEPEPPDGPTEEELAALEAAYQQANAAWRLALQAAAEQMFGFELDLENEFLVQMAERMAVEKLEQARPGIAMLDQLKLLNTAQKGVDAGVAAILASGAAESEEQAVALFTDEGLAATRAQLDAAKAELDENGPILEATRLQLEQAAADIAAGEAELADAKRQLDEGKAQLDAGWREFHAQAETFYDGKRQLEDGKRQLDEGWATLTDRQVELDDAKRQIADARAELADARAELDDARETIAENKQKLADGEIDYAEGKAEAEQELADAYAELTDAQAELDEIEFPSWYVWDRANNVSYNSFAGNATKVEALAGVFPIFFFLVAALVVSTTMTRMVEEERLQIGTMKALGFGNREIMRKYLLYAMAAAVSGALFGLAFGFVVFPSVIWYAYAMMYYVPAFSPVWRWGYAILASGSLVGITLAVTLLTCRSSLQESPAALMRPRAPKAGKRILLERIRPLWRRLSFTYKVTFRNLFRYKRRFWMTVIGVAGCTALLVTGFGISDSINGIMVKQFTDVSQYDLTTAVTDAAAIEQGPVHDYLFGDASEGEVTSSLAAMTELTTQQLPDGATAEVYLMVPQSADALGDYIRLHERVSRAATPLGETGVVMTEKLAELLGVRAGDTVTLANGDDETAQFTVSGVCENYVANYVYLSADTYQAAFGDAPEWNSVLSILADDSQAARDAASQRLLAMDDVTSLTFTADMMTQVLNMLNAINAVVVMIVVCAAVLALVVLYNLTNINVAERVKEIATIKVLGFYDREVSAYVMRETVALTIIGALFGLAGGIALHRFVIYTVEVDAVMFGRTIDPSSFVYALALTMLFSMIVNLLMGRKLKKISMVESMKAPE